MVPIVVAAIALAGTLVGALLAHRRWKVERRSKYDEERRQVYRSIWEQAEALNLQYRTRELSDDTYRVALTALNVAMLKASPHLDEPDRALIRDYVHAVESFLRLVALAGDDDVTIPVGDTDRIPAAVASRMVALGKAQEVAMALRERVVERMRTVLQSS